MTARRKGERRIAVLGNEDLKLFGCDDVDALPRKLNVLGIRRHIGGWSEQRRLTVRDYYLPEAMRDFLRRSRQSRAVGLDKAILPVGTFAGYPSPNHQAEGMR